MLEWLIPMCAFFPFTALYLGALRIEPGGGRGVHQVLGLLFTLVIYLAVWRALHAALSGVGPILGGVVLTIVVATLLLPLEARLGYLVVGARLKRTAAAH
ncbi:MAG: hypothetical protein HYT81_00930 [Gemmatimonadetes bacterium]|nr:hypothetical protein [Gemmatimonadota bacterium]